jgi:general secretion pathway protein G
MKRERELEQIRKNPGFTLVELLIVIVIIGILAGSMMLLMGGGTAKAKATQIVSDLRTMKAGAMMLWSDGKAATLDNLKTYVDKDLPNTKYGIVSSDSGIFVCVAVTESDVQGKLGEIVKNEGLQIWGGGTCAVASGDTYYDSASQKGWAIQRAK